MEHLDEVRRLTEELRQVRELESELVAQRDVAVAAARDSGATLRVLSQTADMSFSALYKLFDRISSR